MAAGAPDSQPLAAGLSAQQLVTPMQPVVSPDAVTALVDAFHKGIITAGDINDRIGAVAQANKKAHLEQLSEFVSPEAIQSRMAQIGAEGAQAGLQTQQAQAAGELVQPLSDLAKLKAQRETADTLYGADGLTSFQTLAPFFNESPSAYLTKEGKPDLSAMAQRGVQMKGQMSIANNWLMQLTPVKDLDVTEADGSKTVHKLNQWGVDVTPPIPGVSRGSDAYWSYIKHLDQYLPDAHPARGQFLMNPTKEEKDLLVGHPPEATNGIAPIQPKIVDSPQLRAQVIDGMKAQGIDEDEATKLVSRATADDVLQLNQQYGTPTPTIAPATVTTPAATTAVPTVLPIGQPPAAAPTILPVGMPIAPGQTTSEAKKSLEELPDVKAFSTSKPVYIGFADASKNSIAKPSAVNDLSLAESYSKLFDPQATLREFKFEALQEAIPWLSKFKDLPAIIAREHTFPAEVRKEIVKSGLDVINAREKALQSRFAYAEAQHPGILDAEQKQILQGVPFAQRFGVDTSTPAAAPTGLQTLPSGRRVMWVPNQ